jgi:uncharacterized phage protein (TIGR02218 family)
MAHDTGNALQSLLDGATMYLTRIYRIKRQDGSYKRLTDHDSDIVIREGFLDGSSDLFSNDETYTPTTGVVGAAVRQESGIKEANTELAGLISSDLITDADLRAGIYQDATIDIAYCDWRYPWLGLFRHNQFRLVDFSFDEERWTAQAVNKYGELMRKFGRRWSKTCWNTFMDVNCGVAKAAGTTWFRAQVVASVTDNANFAFSAGTDDGTGEIDDYYKAGHIRWLTGNNKGVKYPIYQSRQSGATIKLSYPTRATIQVGDTFDLLAGCERTITACASTTVAGKVDNHLRFGGAPHSPGATKIINAGAAYRV